jgi:DNA-binding MarR family transcriptional regulator
MTEPIAPVSDELLGQLQKIPYLLHRAFHHTLHRVYKDKGFLRKHQVGHALHGALDERHFGAHGQHKLLGKLLDRDGILLKDIVEELDIRPSSASELVAKLEKRGYVWTEVDADDKRAKRVFVTEKTREHADKIKLTRSELATEMLAALSAQEQEQLLSLLKKLTASFEELGLKKG